MAALSCFWPSLIESRVFNYIFLFKSNQLVLGNGVFFLNNSYQLNKPLYSAVLLMLISFFGFTQQNLVPNPSFESYDACPNFLSEFTVKDWFAIGGTTDYYNSCGQTEVSVPTNVLGYQSAKSGNAYVGFGIGFYGNINIREYVQIKLSSKLDAFQAYHFSCFVSRADSTNICISEIGIAFSNTAIGGAFASPILFNPQLTSPVGDFVCETNSWVQIEGDILAGGDEEYLTIGYFKDDANSDTMIVSSISNGSGNEECAYYYLDDVSLTLKETPDIANVFTPNGDGSNDSWIFDLSQTAETIILNRWGQEVSKITTKQNEIIFWNGVSNNGEKCSDGIYFYKVIAKNSLYTGYIHLIR